MKQQPHPIAKVDDDTNTGPGRPGNRVQDPHGEPEHQLRRYPDPEPVPEKATFDGAGRKDPPRLATQMGPNPGFGPDEFTPPKIEGNPDLGIDPRQAAAATGDGR